MSKAVTDVSLYLEGAAAAELVDDWALGHSEAFSSSWDEMASREVELCLAQSINAGMEIGDVLTLWELQSNCAWSQCNKYHLDLQWRLISISENCLSKVFLKLKESIISDTSIKDLQTDKATTLSIDVSTTISKSSYSARFGRRTQASLAAAPVRKLVSQFRVLLDFRSTLNACLPI